MRPEVAEYIKAEAEANFRVTQFWADLLDRLKVTALREGVPIPGKRIPSFLFVAEGAPSFLIPTIQVAYTCLGDTLTVHAALVWQESDQEDPQGI